jgi:hypothetical protein
MCTRPSRKPGHSPRCPVRAEVLPPDLLEAVEVDDRGRVERPSSEVRAEVFLGVAVMPTEATSPVSRSTSP